MSPSRIEVTDLCKDFRNPQEPGPLTWRGLFRGLGRPARPSVSALRDVSLSVSAGEMLGVIGRNGAGKSTLLNLLAGVIRPTRGSISIDGRIGGLLELGGGFVDDLTGRENVVLAGVSAGLTRREVYSRLNDIAEFAEMTAFLDTPVRTYSTGMRMRLAFSVAVHTSPDVLLVDEFLSVGDLAFQARCRGRIADLRSAGCAIVLVSHGMGEVRETCDRVLWLRDGGVAALDDPDVVASQYEEEMHQRTLQLSPSAAEPARNRRKRAPGQRIGSREMEIAGVQFPGGNALRSGAPFVLEIAYRGGRSDLAPIFVVSITNDSGAVCVDTNTEAARISTERLPSPGTIRFSIPRLELRAGRYFANVGIFDPDWSHAYDHHWQMYPFSVDGAPSQRGIVAPLCKWDTPPVPAPVSSGL